MRKRGGILATAGCLALSAATFLSSGSANAVDGPEKTDAQKNAEIIAYGDQYPDDLVGLDDLVFKYTGSHIQVGLPGQSEAVGAEEAEKIIAEQEDADTGGFKAAAVNIPAIHPAIVVSELIGTGPAQYRVTGRWDFPDSWAGQKSPVDIASLTFNSGLQSCDELVNYNISTFSSTGTNTGLGSLRTSGGGTEGVWNVKDGVTGFESQADHGGAGVTVKDGCAGSKKHKVGAAFDYEANVGGSITSVSVGFGVLSVSYANQGSTRQEGTAPVYFSL